MKKDFFEAERRNGPKKRGILFLQTELAIPRAGCILCAVFQVSGKGAKKE